MNGKKFLRIAAIAFVGMTLVMTPLFYVVLFKPKGIAAADDPDLTAHLLTSGLWAAVMSVLLLSAYWVSLRLDRDRQKAA